MIKRKFPSFRFILIFLILILGIYNFNYAIMIKLSLEKLTMDADAIVYGEVKTIQSQWSMDRSIILTIVTLQIHNIFKGNFINNQVLIQYPGGKVGDISLQVEDTPSFQMDEKVIVFLKSIKDIMNIKHSPTIALNIFQAFSVYGAAQGKYSIDNNRIARKWGYSLLGNEHDKDNELTLSELETRIKVRVKKDFK